MTTIVPCPAGSFVPCSPTTAILEGISKRMSTLSTISTRNFAVIACEDGEKWGFEEKIAELYIKAFQENGDNWTKFRAVSGEIPTKEDLDKYHAFVFSGSRYSANDDKEWIRKLKEFIQIAARKNPRPKLVGVCFGHQLLASALGGVVDRNPSGKFVLQSEELELSEELKKKPAFSRLCENGSPIRLLEMHGECVKALPEGAKALAKSATCEYEIVDFKENILGIQSHPELSVEDVFEKVLKTWLINKRITEQESKDVLKSINLPLQSSQMKEALRRYMHD